MAALVSKRHCHKVATIAGDKSKKMIDQFKRVYGIDGVAPSVCSVRGGGTWSSHVTTIMITYKIRKLTPRECWRLMDFDDEDFDKAQKVCSDTQLYKQAGNSICVCVLDEIFKALFMEEKEEEQITFEGMERMMKDGDQGR